jgi:hypothetical protein
MLAQILNKYKVDIYYFIGYNTFMSILRYIASDIRKAAIELRLKSLVIYLISLVIYLLNILYTK